MKLQDTIIPGLKIIELPAFTDERGLFVKTFHDATLQDAGIRFRLMESYFSLSKKGVIRGMHFQMPPYEHAKIVFCPQGAIMDVVVDLRKGSVTYGEHFAQELSAENHLAYYIPEGCAHGFKALTDDAFTYYLVSSEYNKEHDTGIRYDSFGYDWGIEDPVLSVRDLSFATLEEFDTPFSFE